MVIEFEKTNGIYTLKDAIHLPDDHSFTEQDIENIKQQRFDNFIAIIAESSQDEGVINGN